MLKKIKWLLPFLLLVTIVFVLDRPWGMLPALGKLLTPFHGYFQQIEQVGGSSALELELSDLREEVRIAYDEHAVPHIFAQNDHDLYFAQGYVVARDRLWQMEFYTLAAAGRLSEIVGRSALPLDRYHRRIGMAETAARIIQYLEKSDPLSMEILEAYAAGVNAYLETLHERSLPLEYKILGYKPEPWTPYKSILMLMNMRLDLSGGSDDYRMSHVLHQFGQDITRNLFPEYPTLESPIIPEGTSWDFEPVSRPEVPRAQHAPLNKDSLLMGFAIPRPRPEIGSNNWVLAGERTVTGLPILANDPHLSLTLPSIWYQIQLHSPDVNTYGVCLPGTPTVIIGFNQNIAWGVTNMAPDVLDFYRIRFKDVSKKEYWHDGQWKPVSSRIDTLHIKGEDFLLDTVYSTHHGPLVYHEAHPDNRTNFPVGHAMRWVANEADGSDLMTFYYLNRASNYADYREALTHFISPAQNFIFGSNTRDIAITPNGRVPLKWQGQGRFLLDGELPEHDWQGWIPYEHLPTVRNPEQGFLSSANQFPVAPDYPYYLGARFTHSSRAVRINERLSAMHAATTADMNDLLNDNFNIDARRILPDLLQVLAADEAIVGSAEYRLLADWDYENHAESIAASIYEWWIPQLMDAIWEDEFPSDQHMIYPSLDRTFDMLLNEPDAPWFDNRHTRDQLETKADVVRASYFETLENLGKRHGKTPGERWEWARVKNTTISHLVPNFTMFSRHAIRNGGGARIVNATSSRHGPSWRMVVELDDDWPRAYGIYPGGQSGNPGSPFYDNMVDRWAAGELDTLHFVRGPEQEPSQGWRSTLTLSPEHVD